MSAVGLESIDHTVQLTHLWINDLNERLGWDNKHRSYRLLRSVLQAVRDWLGVNEAAAFGAELPELLRGVYYEHWRPAATPVKPRHRADFIARIDRAFQTDPLRLTEDEVATVFTLLSEKLAAGDSWSGWRVSLIAAAGETLIDEERIEFKRLTGRARARPPSA